MALQRAVAAAAVVTLWLRQVVLAAGGDNDMIEQEVKYIWPTTLWTIPFLGKSPNGRSLMEPETVARIADIGEKAFDRYVKEILPKELEVDEDFREWFENSDASRINMGFLRWQKRVFSDRKRVPLIDLSWDGSPIPRHAGIDYKFDEFYKAKEYKELGKQIERIANMYLNSLQDPDGRGEKRRLRTFMWFEVFRYADSYRPHTHTGALLAGEFYARFTGSPDGNQLHAFEDARGINPPHGKTHNHEIEQGDLLLFPSWASHFISPHRANTTNVYVHFVSWPPHGANELDWEDDPAGDFVLTKTLSIKKPKSKQAKIEKEEL